MLKRICPSLRCSPPPTAQSSLNVSRRANHFPSSAAVGGKRHFRFFPLRVATGGRLCTCEKGHPGLSLRVSIPCPRLYGLVRSRLHARGRCELSSASAGFMSLPSGGRLDRGPHVGIPLDTFHSVISVLHTWKDLLGVSPWILCTIQFGYTLQFARNPPFQRGSSYCGEQRQRGFCPATGSLFSSAQRSNRRGLLFPVQGIQILNYLANWLILASYREQVIRHRDSLILHLRALGLRLNGQKSVLTPAQQTIFFGSLPELNLDASPSGPCSGREHSVVCGPAAISPCSPRPVAH